jgi:hypothetical protein
MTEFYIGYLPKAPAVLARHMRKTVIALKTAAVAAVLTLVAVQQPFAAAAFEFLKWREFTGIVQERPYPALRVAHPGGESSYLLVRPGKHGAAGLVRGLEGRSVRLQAQLIYRGSHTMLEVKPASLELLAGRAEPEPPILVAESVTLQGEIVDSKCFLGVMNPSTGKVHRDCAARCISGGIPPALLVRSGEHEGLYLLIDERGEPMGRQLLPRVAEPVRVSGSVLRQGSQLLLRTRLQEIRSYR